MIPPIIDGLISYLEPRIAVDQGKAQFSIWDGETPRWDAQGNAVGPTNVTGSWPAVTLMMQEPGFKRTYTMSDAIMDQGIIIVQVWSTTRVQTNDVVNFIIEQFEQQVSVYTDVDLDGPNQNPNYIIEMLVDTWWVGVDPNYRTANSQYLYRGDVYFDTKVHGNAPTTN